MYNDDYEQDYEDMMEDESNRYWANRWMDLLFEEIQAGIYEDLVGG